MPEFLADNNICGQSILQLVSRGNAIIAEILRLKDYVPSLYKLESKHDAQKYTEVVLDFSYFRIAEVQENKIENSDTLMQLDQELRDNYLQIIKRFYLLFESIHSFAADLNHYIDELNDGLYLHQSLETVFSDMDGRQLMCEALYLYGTMLLLVDFHIEGIFRERLLVSYYRYTPERRDTQSCIDDVCKLLRDTGLSAVKKPLNYPEDYFKRMPLNETFIETVISRLRSDDIYNQLANYPSNAKQRSTALAQQAAQLYVCFYFAPQTLHREAGTMREIVDKYFGDNWNLALYMGHSVNLIEAWDAFKAAKTALNNTLDVANVKSYASWHGGSVDELINKTNLLLQEGNITAENLLQKISDITHVLRSCNVCLRWLMLHCLTTPKQLKFEKIKKSKQMRELAITESKYNPTQVFKLLLNTAQLELFTKDLFKDLVGQKDTKWMELKTKTENSLCELSEVFGGTKPLTRIAKNPSLEHWFGDIAKHVAKLPDHLEKTEESGNTGQAEASARKIIQLVQALVEVQAFHQLDADMQVKQYILETRGYLEQMLRNMKINEDVLITLQIIGDVSYAWELIDCYTEIMQKGITAEPNLVIKLRAVFLKLASALETPLLRINEAHSDDLLSVSQYYSSELEIYVRRVLQIIPKTMFEKMARIIEMQTSVLKELPTHLEKDKLKEYAQLNERYEFAELTHSISIFSEGMRMMKSTLVGIICLDPKRLLEDGIRRELVQHISKALHNCLVFSAKPKQDELEMKLKTLGKIIDGYKRSFEYIQDYVNINGLKIWQEEVTRIINYNVEMECNSFLKNKIHDWDSIYQSKHVPIPYFPPIDQDSENFIGRLAKELIRLTDPKSTTYIGQTSTWYDLKTQKSIVTKQMMSLITSSIEITGLVGLDRLFSFMIVKHLRKIYDILDNKRPNNPAWTNILQTVSKELETVEALTNPIKFYQNSIARSSKLFVGMNDSCLEIGQLQLLRNLIAFHLNMKCKFDAKYLESSLSSLNKALLNDLMKENSSIDLPEKLMSELSHYFDYAGLNNPTQKIYLTVKPNKEYSTIIFIFALVHMQKLFFYNNPSALSKRTNDIIDGTAFVYGVHTIFKQLHQRLNEIFIKHLCDFVILISRQSLSTKNNDLPNESVLAIKFLELYSTLSEINDNYYKKHLAEEIVHLHTSISSNN